MPPGMRAPEPEDCMRSVNGSTRARCRNFSCYEAIADDESIRLAGVTGQIQLATALAVGVPRERIDEFTDQGSSVRAVLVGDADASVSTAPGNSAYVEWLGTPEHLTMMDRYGFDALALRPILDR
jgi:hypothetical protein